MEELRAELASAFVANELGIPTDIPHHASYIANWIKALKDDKREIFRAAADAQRIASMELGFHPDYSVRVDGEGLRAAGLAPGCSAHTMQWIAAREPPHQRRWMRITSYADQH